MKNFLLGVASTLAVLFVVAAASVLILGSGADPRPTATASGSVSGAGTPPPTDLGDDETWLGEVELRSADVVSPDGELVDVEAAGAGIRFSEEGLRAQRLDIDTTIPFDTVAEQIGTDVRLYAAGSGLTGVERDVTILGRDLTVRATGSVVADGGQLVIEPETVDLGGPSFLNSAVSTIARELVTIRQDVPGMPEGMDLTEISVSGAGFDASLNGTDVLITR